MVTKPDFVKCGSRRSRFFGCLFWSNIIKRRSLAFSGIFTSTQKEKDELHIWLWFAIFPKIPSGRTIGRCVTLLSGMKPVDNGFREMLSFKTSLKLKKWMQLHSFAAFISSTWHAREWKEGLTPQHLVQNLSSFGQWTCEFLSSFSGGGKALRKSDYRLRNKKSPKERK